MAIKTNDIQEFRNLGLENEFDFYDFGDLIESGTNFNYTGTVDPPGGAENSEYLVTLPIMFHKLTSKNFADEEELPEYRVEYYIELLDKMHDRLRSPEGNTLYDHMLKGIKAYEKDGHPGAVQKFYEGLHKADEVFGLGLHIEELDPDYEKAIESAKAEEVKLADEKKQQEAKRPRMRPGKNLGEL